MGSASHLPPQGGDYTRQQQPGQVSPAGMHGLPPAKKGGGVWLWMIGGCLGLVLIGGIGFAVLGYVGVKKFQETTGLSSEELKERPAFAAAKLITAFNPEIELVDADESTQRITIREKSTGKTVTVTLDQLKDGRITFSDSEGEEMSMQIEGKDENGSVRIQTSDGREVFSMQAGEATGNDFPSWVPVPQGLFTSRNRISNGDTKIYAGKLSSPLSAEQFANWFDGAVQAAGLEVKSKTVSQSGNTVSVSLLATSADENRTLQTAGTQNASGGVDVVFTVIEKN